MTQQVLKEQKKVKLRLPKKIFVIFPYTREVTTNLGPLKGARLSKQYRLLNTEKVYSLFSNAQNGLL